MRIVKSGAMENVDRELAAYVEREIIPRYREFDAAHREDHVRTVIRESLHLAAPYGLDPNQIYAAAAWHDTGLVAGRERHHLVSGEIVAADGRLREWFTQEQIRTIREAVEDHRASAGGEPRSLYGRIVAEADRVIDPDVTLRRTVSYGLAHYPELDREGQYARFRDHLQRKYAPGGYLKLLVPESKNRERLERLQALIASPVRLRKAFDDLYDELRNVISL